jgi:hypothetical protein
MVQAVDDWPWSRYQAIVGLAPAPTWLDVAALLRQFAPTRETAQMQYRQFVTEGVDTPAPWTQLQVVYPRPADKYSRPFAWCRPVMKGKRSSWTSQHIVGSNAP